MTETVTSTQPLVVAPGETKPGFAGTNVPRKEDKRLVQGEGVFFDDIKRHGMGYVHFVRSPYAHAKIVSIDVSKALELGGVYGTLTGDEVAILTDPFFELSVKPGADIKDYALAVGRVRHVGEPVVGGRRVVARARTRRGRARGGRVRAAARADDRGGRAAQRDDPARRSRLERRLVGRLRLGRLRGRRRRGRPRREDRAPALRPLLVDAARVRRRALRVQPRHRAVDDVRQPPDARHRRDLDGARAAHRHRQAALRLAGHRRRVRQQDLPAPAVRRVLPARAQAQPAGAVDGVAHRPAHGERARQRAHVPRDRGAREGGRDAARAEGARARRLRRVPALRAARLHHLGAGHAGLLPLAEHPRRLHAGLHEQVAGVAEPRLLAHAAPLADGARDRPRRARARARPGRRAQAELRARRRDAVRDAERLRLRLGRLRARARRRARSDRLRRARREARATPSRAASCSASASDRLSIRARTTSASRRCSTRSCSSRATTRSRR